MYTIGVDVGGTSGGGGYGDPLRRDLVAVLADVIGGYVSPAAAKCDYGVVIAGEQIDPLATESQRADLTAGRFLVRLESHDTDYENGRRIGVLSAAAAAQLGLADGTFLEIVNPDGAPLRCWVRVEAVTAADAYLRVGPLGASRCSALSPARGPKCARWNGSRAVEDLRRGRAPDQGASTFLDTLRARSLQLSQSIFRAQKRIESGGGVRSPRRIGCSKQFRTFVGRWKRSTTSPTAPLRPPSTSR